MGRDTVTGKNKKWGRHKEKEVEDVTEETLMAALAIHKTKEEESGSGISFDFHPIL
jgi:hypothetical protein